MPSERSENQLHSHFTFGSEPSFEVVSSDGDDHRVKILHTLKQVNFSLEDEPREILEAATQLIDGLIAEEKVSEEDRERLLDEARQGYARVFNSFPLL